MKMLPIVYRQRYSNDAGDDDVHDGFEPTKDGKGGTISERFVDIEPRTWQQGSCLVVTINDVVNNFDGKQTVKIHSRWIYDNPTSYDGRVNEADIIPTKDQALLIQALASQELRGRFAESTVFCLYLDLVVLNPKFEFDKWLPDVVKFHKDILARYGFKKSE